MRIAVGKAGAIGPLVPDEAEPEVVVRGIVRERDGHCLVSLFLVNAQVSDGGRSVHGWLCQAHLEVSAADDSPVFVRRQIDAIEPGARGRPSRARRPRDAVPGERRARGRARRRRAGHRSRGCARTAGRGCRPRSCRQRRCRCTEAPGPADFDDARIRAPFTASLCGAGHADAERSDATQSFRALLSPLADAYEAWIAAQERRIADPDARLDGFEGTARDHLAVAREGRARVSGPGIASLGEPDVAEAFRFANHAMWQQRVHTIAGDLRRRNEALKLHEALATADVARNRSWRPFQLAFVLLNLPALADPKHPERSARVGSWTCCSSRPVAARRRPTSG